MLEVDRWVSIETGVIQRVARDGYDFVPAEKKYGETNKKYYRMLKSKISLIDDGESSLFLAFVLFKEDGAGKLEATVRKKGGYALAFDELKAAFYSSECENDPRIAIEDPPANDGRRTQQRLTWRLDGIDFTKGETGLLVDVILNNLNDFHRELARLNDLAKGAGGRP